MLKKFSKLLLAFLLIIVTISSLSTCYATDTAVTTSETEGEAVTTSEEETNSTEDEIYSGDLYLFDNDIVMDKLVDGNVFIFGNNVEITGQVNGDLFVFANTVSFDESYVRYTTYACANKVYYNGACNDLYVATNNLEMTYDSYVVRDVKAVSSNAVFLAAIGRDVDLLCNTVNFGEGDDVSVIYGNLRYTANNEVEIPEGVISGGTATYTAPSDLNTNTTSSVTDLLMTFLTFIVTVLVIYAIIKKCTPNFAEKLSNEQLSVLRLLKAFGLGFLTIILFAFIFVILLITRVGLDLALILLTLFILLCLISIPVLTIVITNNLKPAFKIEKTSMFCLILVLVSIVLQGIALIPFVGKILTVIISFTALGLLIDIFLPHKKFTDEEKAALEEAKKQAKEDKEKRKQEKFEAKAVKKQEKLEAKETKKNESKE